MKTKITVADILNLNPCGSRYTEEYLAVLFGGRNSVTAKEILLDTRVPAEDKLWVVLREEFLPEALLYEFACFVAESLLQAERAEGREPDVRSWAAIEARRSWLRGEIDDTTLAAARAAAWDAVRAAAWDAAMAAAWDAAMVASRDAAWAAVWAATRAAAGVAARIASRDAAARAAARAAAGDVAWVAAMVAAEATARGAARAAAGDVQVLRLLDLL